MSGRAETQIDILRPQDLTSEDAVLWAGFVSARPELAGPYFDIRYVQAIGAKVPCGAVARITQDGRVVGYFPFQIRAGALQPLGAPMTDYHGLIGEAGCPFDYTALLTATKARRLDFQGWVGPMCGKAEALVLQRRVADTSEGFEAWYARQDHEHHKFFKNIARCERNIAKDFGGFDFTWERVTPEVLDWVIALKREQYKKTGLHDIFDCGWTRDLLDNLAALDDETYGLRAGVFRHEGKLVAAEISLMNTDSIHLWFPAYDPAYYRYTVGIVLTMAIIRELAPKGIKSFDFGTGGEDYKSPMTTYGGQCFEGSLQYAPRIASRMMDATVAMLPARPKMEQVRLSFRRRVNVIRSTEVSFVGWGKAVYAMGQRALMRIKPAKV